MPETTDSESAGTKIFRFFQRLVVVFRTFLGGMIRSFQNYIRSKTRHIPTNLPKRRREIINDILEHKHHQEFLQGFAQECGMPLEQVEKNFRDYLHEIAADQNYLYIPFGDAVLTWVFDTMYEGFDVDLASLEKLRPLIGEKPIVFVPNHRSHMDYLILAYVLYHQSIPIPIICAGKNLSFWPIGSYFRKGGAFFIRRSYEGNKLYAAAVQAYIEELIREKAVFEFFIEGGRSRTGKLLPPKMGVLNAIAQSYSRGAASEIFIVPTSFTYESVLEDKSYFEEQAGGSKKEETFWDLFRIRKYLRKRYGKVYIRFGEPISASEYLTTETAASGFKEQVPQLASEITYGINKSTVVTPSALASTALLSDTARAISQDRLLNRVDLYTSYLKNKGVRLSEPIQKYDHQAIREAIRDQVKGHLIQEFYDLETPLYRTIEEKRPILDYYKNNSIHYFVSIGVLATILIANKNQSLTRRLVEEEYQFFQELFQYEFTYSRRLPLNTHILALLTYLEERQCLRIDGDTLNLSQNDYKKLEFFSALVRNFFESYFILWSTLPLLGKRRWESKELIRFVLDRGRILYLKEEISRPEAVNKFTLQNALLVFRDLGLLKEEKEGIGKRKRTFYSYLQSVETVGEKLGKIIKGEKL